MDRKAFVVLLSLAAVVGVIACGNDRTATCRSVTHHVMQLQADERVDRGLDPLSRESDALRRRQSIDQCEKRKVSQEELQCVMAADTREEVRACQRDKG